MALNDASLSLAFARGLENNRGRHHGKVRGISAHLQQLLAGKYQVRSPGLLTDETGSAPSRRTAPSLLGGGHRGGGRAVGGLQALCRAPGTRGRCASCYWLPRCAQPSRNRSLPIRWSRSPNEPAPIRSKTCTRVCGWRHDTCRGLPGPSGTLIRARYVRAGALAGWLGAGSRAAITAVPTTACGSPHRL